MIGMNLVGTLVVLALGAIASFGISFLAIKLNMFIKIQVNYIQRDLHKIIYRGTHTGLYSGGPTQDYIQGDPHRIIRNDNCTHFIMSVSLYSRFFAF